LSTKASSKKTTAKTPRRAPATRKTGASDVPVRSNEIGEGTPGEAPSVHGTGFQQESDAPHPTFPDQGNASMQENAEKADEAAIRRRAYELWEEEGYPQGGHERHWAQAERELRSRRK